MTRTAPETCHNHPKAHRVVDKRSELETVLVDSDQHIVNHVYHARARTPRFTINRGHVQNVREPAVQRVSIDLDRDQGLPAEFVQGPRLVDIVIEGKDSGLMG